MSDSLRPVDFGIRLVNYFVTLTKRPVRLFFFFFFGGGGGGGAISNYRSTVRQSPYKFM